MKLKIDTIRNKTMSEFINNIFEQVKTGEIVAGQNQVFFLRKGAPILKEMETEVIAERYARFLESEKQFPYLTRGEALKQIIEIVKEEIELGFSLFSDSIVVDFADLKTSEDKLKQVEMLKDFFDWVRA